MEKGYLDYVNILYTKKKTYFNNCSLKGSLGTQNGSVASQRKPPLEPLFFGVWLYNVSV